MGIFSLDLRIPAEMLQSRYVHLHHAQALNFLEKGRIGLLESIGQPIDRLLEAGIGLVITRIDIQYRRELRSEAITVTCDEGAIEDRSLRISQRILNSKGKEAVVATVWSAVMSLETRRGLEVPPELRTAFEGWTRTLSSGHFA